MKKASFKLPQDRIIRCQALDRCFSDQTKYYYIEDLLRCCNDALVRSDLKPVSKRTVRYDIDFMESYPYWNVDLLEGTASRHNGRRFFRYKNPDYSIWKNDLSEQQLQQLKSVMILMRQFNGLPQYNMLEDVVENLAEKYKFNIDVTDNVISFDTNQYVEGIQYISVITNSILHKQTLNVSYQPYGKDLRIRTIHPYHVKQYNGRWFLFGLDDEIRRMSNLPLDRIKNIENSDTLYVDSDINFNEFFDDMLGVTIGNEPIQTVVLKFCNGRLPYVITKPIHGSQKLKDSENGIVEIRVSPNNELYQILLSFGKDVEVLSPVTVRDKIKNIINDMKLLYE